MLTSSTISQDLTTTIQPINPSEPLQIEPSKLTASSTFYPQGNLPTELTAEAINPQIRLRISYKSPIDLTVLAYKAASNEMATEYLPTSDEARQLLANLPANLPIITSLRSFETNGSFHDDIRWYALSAAGEFEATTYTDWQTVNDRLLGISRPSFPIAQAVATVLPELQPLSSIAQTVPIRSELQPARSIQDMSELILGANAPELINLMAPIQHSEAQSNPSGLSATQSSADLAPLGEATVFASFDLSAIALKSNPALELPIFSNWQELTANSAEQMEPILLDIKFDPLETL
jgi:hypothetical protein